METLTSVVNHEFEGAFRIQEATATAQLPEELGASVLTVFIPLAACVDVRRLLESSSLDPVRGRLRRRAERLRPRIHAVDEFERDPVRFLNKNGVRELECRLRLGN
jgi:hypothetical protein